MHTKRCDNTIKLSFFPKKIIFSDARSITLPPHKIHVECKRYRAKLNVVAVQNISSPKDVGLKMENLQKSTKTSIVAV
jgi:hypothetical protein